MATVDEAGIPRLQSWEVQRGGGRDLAKRLEGLSPGIQAMAWKAQIRLHKKLMRLVAEGKSRPAAVIAVARELLGFAWAIGQEVNSQAAIGRRLA